MKGKKGLYLLLGGVAALVLLSGAVVSFAQSESAAVEEIAPVASDSSLLLIQDDQEGEMPSRGQALADALGITLTELETAIDAARNAIIDQAVADGKLTEEQGEFLKEHDRASRFMITRFTDNWKEYLAASLGISVEELEAAELTAIRNATAEAVAAGKITQEQADLMLAEKVARSYLDTDAIDAQIQSAQEAAIAAALADGAITQAQADALLAQLAANPYHFGGGFGGFGGHGGRGGHGGPGGMRGFGLEQLPGSTTPDATPDTTPDTTNTAFDA